MVQYKDCAMQGVKRWPFGLSLCKHGAPECLCVIKVVIAHHNVNSKNKSIISIEMYTPINIVFSFYSNTVELIDSSTRISYK